MNHARTDILLFIDLGFILLVGFLMLVETATQAEVLLPNESQAESNPGVVYEVQFDERMRFMVLLLPQGEPACVPETLVHLASCLEQASRQNMKVSFLLAPQGRATVQQMVSMLDLCTRRGWRCTVGN